MNDSNRSKATRAPTTTDDDDARSRASHASRRTRLSRLSARARHFRAPPSVVVVVVVVAIPIQTNPPRRARRGPTVRFTHPSRLALFQRCRCRSRGVSLGFIYITQGS
jgi:hypothetical protein